MGKSDIEIAVLRHRRARIRELRHKQVLLSAAGLSPQSIDSMDPETYMVATEGNITGFDMLVQDNEVPFLREVTPQGNTILHLAAIYGHIQLLVHIINHELKMVGNWISMPKDYQGLLLRPNSNGDLPLHVAAATGNALVVNVLIDRLRELPPAMKILLEGREPIGVRDVWIVQNNEGNTPLHLALEAKNQSVSLSLVQVDERVSFIANEEKVSPLYMAAEAGNVLLVTRMLQSHVVKFKGKSVLHAAIKSKEPEILTLLLSPFPRLIYSRDEEKRSVLSYAASIGYEEGVHFLLRFRDIAYVRDPDGFFPIHSACRKGHIGALRAILQFFPDTIELLNLQGQNVLHIAALSGKNKVVKYILNKEKYAKLINQKDSDRNTPLHLAAMFWYPRIVHTLTRDDRVNLSEVNKKGFTALDAAEECMEFNPTFRERLTWMALVCADTPRALKLMPHGPSSANESQKASVSESKTGVIRSHGPSSANKSQEASVSESKTGVIRSHGPSSANKSQEASVSESETGVIRSHEIPTAKKYKDRVNTLLLLAILVATVAFSAAFTVPEENDVKRARHWTKPIALQVFVISNTIAMYSAVLTTVALIWAQLGDLVLILNVFKFVLPLLGCSLFCMSLAFVAGMFLVVGNQVWLLALLFASGIVFLGTLLLLVVPFICPYTSSPVLFRYVLRYPFGLLMLTVWNDTDDDDSELFIF